MNIWIIVISEPIWTDSANERLHRCGLLAELCRSNGHEVEFFTSSFAHHKKQLRVEQSTREVLDNDIAVNFIHSGSYQSNLSVSRLVHHYNSGKEFENMAKGMAKPDVIFCAYPDMFLADAVVKYAKSNDIPVVVDVRDLWPEIFLHQKIGAKKLVVKPMVALLNLITKRVINNADMVTSITPSMLNWVKNKFNRHSSNDKHYPLAYPLKGAKQVDVKYWSQILGERVESKIICFFGAIGHQFEFDDIIKFVNRHPEYTLVLCGEGEKVDELKRQASSSNIFFPGWVDHSKILGLMSISSIAIAPYIDTFDFRMSIPNKVLEYMFGGVPIVTPLDGDVRELIESVDIGKWYQKGDQDSLLKAITHCLENKEKISIHANKAYHEMFDFDSVYGDLVKELEKLGGKNV